MNKIIQEIIVLLKIFFYGLAAIPIVGERVMRNKWRALFELILIPVLCIALIAIIIGLATGDYILAGLWLTAIIIALLLL